MNNGKLCVSICASTTDEMIAKIRRAEEVADVVEIRFDCLSRGDRDDLIKDLPAIDKTYLFTLRPREQGGKRDTSLAERLKFWESIFYHHKANFMIDLETDAKMMLPIEPNKIRRIISLHNFKGVSADPEITFDVLSTKEESITKLAFSVGDAAECVNVWKLLSRAREQNKEIIPIAMGDAGKWTRVLGLAHGAFMTYASLDEGSETADGQITARDMIDIYRVKELDRETSVYGVLGDPVSSSLSPYMHNPAFAAEKINAVFIPFLIKDLDAFITRMVKSATREVELNFGGFSVTMPHKQNIIKHLDAIDPVGEKIGAVNTIKIDGDKLTGYNTDAHGFIMSLKKAFGDVRGVRIGVFGAGGAARACVYALEKDGADVTIFARDSSKAETLANEMNTRFSKLPDSKKMPGGLDIVVNATPLGMKGPHEGDSLFTADQLSGVKFVYDLVTRADDSPIVAEAKKAGVPAIGGLEMLIEQGLKQFEIWTGRTASADLARKNLLDRLQKVR